MDDIKAKQQIVEKIKNTTNILVTVSNDPTVDALSAALGLTLLLDKLEKHATAVFSGEVPLAIAFLNPEQTFDATTDSLRDFIIALDKEKADHLRYKVEGEAVKIFITPYKTTITSDDLDFSQGDYNVETVIALGVDDQDHLDGALDAHGKILHDASVITLTAGEQTSPLGGIDWHDDQASSLSEMVASLSEALKPDKKSLLNKQISSALLTGIVAQTERFSNTHTTSTVMTVAAQLMAGGADQQLIATKLEEATQSDESDDDDTDTSSSTLITPVDEPVASRDKSTLEITHQPHETLEQLDKRVKAAEQAEAAQVAAEALEDHLEDQERQHDQEAAPAESQEPAPSQPAADDDEPALGGALNATTEQAADDARRAREDDQNKTILSHSYLTASPVVKPVADAPLDQVPGLPSFAPGSASVNDMPSIPTGEPLHTAYADEPIQDLAPLTPPESPYTPPVAPVGQTIMPPLPELPSVPATNLPPDMPGYMELPVAPTHSYAPSPTDPPERLGDILNPEPPSAAPVQPEGTLPLPPQAPLPPEAPFAPLPPAPQPPVSAPADPAQFRIPGQ